MNEEKKLIYQLMKEIIAERRELSKQFFDLKVRLEQLGEDRKEISSLEEVKISKLEREKIERQDYILRNNKVAHFNTFDRVSKDIISILKQSAIPLSNKQILNKLINEYELSISLRNLTNNILPKMKNKHSLPIQKAHRGYWQYKLPRKKGGLAND